MTRVRTFLATVVLLMLTATACGGGQGSSSAPPAKNTLPGASASPSPTPQAVSFTGLPEGTSVKITDQSPADTLGGGLTFVSPIYTMTASDALQSPVTALVDLDNALPAGTQVVVATRDSPADSWAWQAASLTSDLRHVSFRTTHVGQVAAATVDAGSTLDSFRSDVRAGVVSSVGRAVAKPTCTGTKDALLDGYTVTSWSRQTLLWCFGMQGDKRVLRVVNRRTIPVTVSHADIGALGASAKVPRSWTTWASVLGQAPDDTFLPPGATATYAVDIDPEKLVMVAADSTARARSLQVLQASVRALTVRVNAFGFDRPRAYQALLSTLLAKPQCRRALDRGAQGLFAGCLSPLRMRQLYGADSYLLSRVVNPVAERSLVTSTLRGLAAQDRDQIAHHVVVRRAKPDFGALVGFWTGADHRGLRITADGLATEHYYTATTKILELTYQLSLPRVADGTTTAKAVITSVNVLDRKAAKGRIPHVGDAGTISVKNGVVVPSYVGKNYCGAKAFKDGACGRDTKVKTTTTTTTTTTKGTKKH